MVLKRVLVFLVLTVFVSGAGSSSAKSPRNDAGAGVVAGGLPVVLCYSKASGVYIRAANSERDERRLAKANVSDVRISPDGNALALTLDKSPKGAMTRYIAVVEGNESKPRVLAAIPGDNNFGPLWSPDGRSLLFNHYIKEGWHAAVVGRDGTGFRDVSAGFKGGAEGVFAGWWANDSKSVYAFDLDNVYQFDLDGRELRRMALQATFGDIEPSSDMKFDLSPDGKQLLLSAPKEVPDIQTEEGPPVLVFLHDFEKKTTTRLSPKGMWAREPSWLPDGRSFVFLGAGPGTRRSEDLYLMKLESGQIMKVLQAADEPSVSR